VQLEAVNTESTLQLTKMPMLPVFNLWTGAHFVS